MLKIRPAEKTDAEKIGYICIQTADEKSRTVEKQGKITALTYSSYYVREETDHCFVIDDNGVQGYILCAPDSKKFARAFRKTDVKDIFGLNFFAGLFSFFLPCAYIPFRKKYPAHLHIDILESYQSKGMGSALMNTLLNKLRAEKVSGVMLIMASSNEKAARFYKKFGFKKMFSAFGGTFMAKKLN